MLHDFLVELRLSVLTCPTGHKITVSDKYVVWRRVVIWYKFVRIAD